MPDQAIAIADRDRIKDWMIQHINSVLDVSKDAFPIDDRFDAYGLDSVEAVIMAGLMEEEFGVPIDPMEMFEHPSVAQFTDHFAKRLADRG